MVGPSVKGNIEAVGILGLSVVREMVTVVCTAYIPVSGGVELGWGGLETTDVGIRTVMAK